MNYELAKQLKDVGFSLTHMDEFCKAAGCWLKDGIGRKENTHVPTLIELIEACGPNGFYLSSPDTELEPSLGEVVTKWRAFKLINGEGTGRYGDTAEEAVACLWLALNNGAFDKTGAGGGIA